MSRARLAPLLFLAAGLQISTASLAAQDISVSLGENRKEVLQPSAQITLPVLVDMTNADTLDLASLQLRVTWDTAVVGYASWSAGAFGTIEANEDAVAGGTFQANLLSTTGTANSFTAMNLTFDAGAAGSTVAVLGMLAAGSESGGDLLSRIIANSVSICIDAGGLLGDVSSGDLVDVIDAQQIARWLVGLAVGTSNRMRSHGDVNNDGQTNIVDAQQIARWAVELPVDFTIGDTIVLNCADALTVSTPTLPTAAVGTEYSQLLSAAGPGGTHSWSISAGTLPAGLSLVGSTISGTPTATGTSEFTVKVTSGDGQIATRPLSIKVLPGLSVTTASLPAGIVDTAYATTLTATGGDSTFVWSIASGTLPDGLTLSADTISGTPTTAGTSTFTVQVATGDGQTATKELSIAIHGTLSITTTSLSDGMEGLVYKDTLVATGGDSTYTWSVSAGTLPAGLTLNGDTISGTPTTAATSTFTVQVTSGDAQTVTKELSITVTFPQLTITTASLSHGVVGSTYKDTLAATSGDGTYTWSVSTGTLPAGLSLAGDTIAGTPTTAASNTEGLAYTDTLTSTFTVQVTSGDAQTVTKELSLSVFDSLVIDTTLLDPGNFRKGDPYERVVKARGGDGVYTWSVASGSLPPGLILGKRNSGGWAEFAEVEGTPTAAGSFDVTLGVQSGDGQSTTKAVTITVVQIANTVTLSDTSLTFVSLGDTTRITATVKDQDGDTIPDATVTWATSDTTKATVSSTGLVTAVANGTATITATSGGSSKTASVTVDQVPDSITLSPVSLSFASLADTATITPTVKDANDSTIVSPTVTWVSSDTLKATVSSAGLVTSKADGTTTITATSGSKSATVTATVTQVSSSLTLSTDSVSFSSLSDTTTITATLKDANDSTMAGATFTWTSSNTSVATVSTSGLVTSVADGTATITATSDSKDATATVTIDRWISISTGQLGSCGVTTSGKAYCWGGNAGGQIGDGTTTTRNIPTLVSGGHSWKSISSGGGDDPNTCAITTDGAAYCWGNNDMGKLGEGTRETDRLIPTLVLGGHTWDVISNGQTNTCGVTTDGAAYCWGMPNFGQNGNGDIENDKYSPSLVSGSHTWATIDVGYQYACGVTTGGDAYCWGDNGYGSGQSSEVSTPQLVSGGHTWKSSISAHMRTYSVTTAGAIYYWAGGAPVFVSDSQTWDVVSDRALHRCALTTAGAAYCWGDDGYGKLGSGNTVKTDQTAPFLVTGGHIWNSISAGMGEHTCGVTTAGVGYCWGRSTGGRLGGASDAYGFPRKITLPW